MPRYTLQRSQANIKRIEKKLYLGESLYERILAIMRIDGQVNFSEMMRIMIETYLGTRGSLPKSSPEAILRLTDTSARILGADEVAFLRQEEESPSPTASRSLSPQEILSGKFDDSIQDDTRLELPDEEESV